MKKQICVMDYPAYSPDLSPCDYFLFPKLKTVMKGAFYDDVPTIQSLCTAFSMHGDRRVYSAPRFQPGIDPFIGHPSHNPKMPVYRPLSAVISSHARSKWPAL